MTIDHKIGRWREYDGESEQGFRQYKDRIYPMGQSGTLDGADVSMQEGDTLPDDSTYEIISAKIEMVKPITGISRHKGGRAAVLRGMKERYLTAKSGSGDWNELYDSRRVLDSDPQTLRYEIRFSAAISDGPTRPSTGDTYATINGGSSGFPTTGMDREPVAVHVGEVTNATILKRHIVVIFEAHHARTVTGSPGTELNPRILVRTGRKSWKGTMRFSTTLANAQAMGNSVYGAVFPNQSGKYAAKCHRVETHDNPVGMPGRSLVIAQFETPRIVGEGRLRIRVGGEQEVVTRDLDKAVIVGPVPDPFDTSKKKYLERRLVYGKNVRLRPHSVIVVETAATDFQVNRLMDRVDMVNKYLLPNFGNAQPGTLLFLGSPDTTLEFVNDLWYVNLAFKYSGNPKHFWKWNEMVRSQAGNYVPRKVQAVDKDGTIVTGAVKYLQEWVPRKVVLATGALSDETAIEVHRMHHEADFRDIGKDLVITGL